MRYFYYIKTADDEVVYQSEDVGEDINAAKIEKTKDSLKTEIASHRFTKYLTNTSKEIDASAATCKIRWDGSSTFVELIEGTMPASIPFLGWPQIRQEDYVAPAEPVIQDQPE